MIRIMGVVIWLERLIFCQKIILINLLYLTCVRKWFEEDFILLTKITLHKECLGLNGEPRILLFCIIL